MYTGVQKVRVRCVKVSRHRASYTGGQEGTSVRCVKVSRCTAACTGGQEGTCLRSVKVSRCTAAYTGGQEGTRALCKSITAYRCVHGRTRRYVWAVSKYHGVQLRTREDKKVSVRCVKVSRCISTNSGNI